MVLMKMKVKMPYKINTHTSTIPLWYR